MADKHITVTLSEADLLALQEIMLDDDAEGALHFLKESVCPKLPVRGTAACDSTRINPYLLSPGSRSGAAGRPSS